MDLMNNRYSFIPGERVSQSIPLYRFLPNIDEGIASEWIVRYLEKSQQSINKGLLLDPFGSSPTLVNELSRSGFPVLVISPNPIVHFLIEKSITPLGKRELMSAFAQLSLVSVGGQRVEIVIKNLYKSVCNQCNNEVIVDAFVWDLNEDIPIYKIYNCSQCHQKGQYPTSIDDISLAKSFRHTGLHKSWLVEKVIHGNQAYKKNIEEALDVYLPRTLSAIFTILTSLEKIPESFIDPLNYLLISCFDKANTLWHYPTSKSIPKLLTKPTRYFEHNIWHALEEALENYTPTTFNESKMRLHNWPFHQEYDQGVYLYEKKFIHFQREISSQKNIKLPISAVITAIPRYNQAFWTLSAIWSAWLLGNDATTSFISILRRRRFDWAWHTSALKLIFTICSKLIENQTPVFGLINELEPSFFSAAVLGALLSNFKLLGYATRTDTKQAQLHWVYDSQPSLISQDYSIQLFQKNLDDVINNAITRQIIKENEPIPYITIHAAVLDAIADITKEINVKENTINITIGDIHNKIQEILLGSPSFIHYDGSPKNITSGLWWLRNYRPTTYKTHTDLVEEAVVNLLSDGNPVSFKKFDMHICNQFPGNLTPDKLNVIMCLDAYAELVSPEDKLWRLRNQENPLNREADINEIRNLLMGIGEELGYKVEMTDNRIYWLDDPIRSEFQFIIIYNAVLAEIAQTSGHSAKKNLIVIPGGRANLILFKLNHNPYLRNLVNEGWIFMKFRLVRKLSVIPNLTREDFTHQLTTDALVYQNPQLPLF